MSVYVSNWSDLLLLYVVEFIQVILLERHYCVVTLELLSGRLLACLVLRYLLIEFSGVINY